MYIIRKQKKSRLLAIIFSLSTMVLFALIMRLIFFFRFANLELLSTEKWRELAEAFYLGAKFDTRVGIITLLPLIFLKLWLNPKQPNKRSVLQRTLWSLEFILIFAFILVYFVDFGHYAYLHTRLNASSLDNLENPWISAHMVWETYPVVPLVILLFVLTWMLWMALRRINNRFWLVPEFSNARFSFPLERTVGFFVVALLFYGKLSYFPLRWSEAFFSTDPFLGELASNPHLSFFSTWHFKSPEYDLKAVKDSYPVAANFLQVPVEQQDSAQLNFLRTFPENEEKRKMRGDYNVVVIQVESLAYNKTSLSGNPTDPTPLLGELGPKSLYYSRCYTPTEATARGVFATLSGIPDVTFDKSSSRNPLLTDQMVLMNQFPDHDKFYFLGGSANWGNIRAIFSRNIDNVQIYEEGSYHSPRNDVWGISDLDLFKEANEVLAKQTRPFVAYIQTAGFHRPYTIPPGKDAFQVRNDLPEEKVVRHSFDSLEEYNSMRFQDYSMARFLALASKEKYFDKTLFVIFGDHGLPSQHADHMNETEIRTRLTNHHVPLLFYGPGWLSPQQVDDVICSQTDIFPTVMGILGLPYHTRSFGRNLLAPRASEEDNEAFLFSFHHRPKYISLVDKNYLYVETESSQQLIDINAPEVSKDVAKEHPEIVEKKSQLVNALFETAKYLRYFNKKSK